MDDVSWVVNENGKIRFVAINQKEPLTLGERRQVDGHDALLCEPGLLGMVVLPPTKMWVALLGFPIVIVGGIVALMILSMVNAIPLYAPWIPALFVFPICWFNAWIYIRSYSNLSLEFRENGCIFHASGRVHAFVEALLNIPKEERMFFASDSSVAIKISPCKRFMRLLFARNTRSYMDIGVYPYNAVVEAYLTELFRG